MKNLNTYRGQEARGKEVINKKEIFSIPLPLYPFTPIKEKT
jgi:hypothetical protein